MDISFPQMNRAKITKAPRFDDCEEQDEDDDRRSCAGFIILGGPQKFKLKQVEAIQGLEWYMN